MNFFDKNLCTSTDSYKATHGGKPNPETPTTVGTFPEGTTRTSYYIEARSDNEEIVAAGFNFVAKVLEQGVKVEHVERANRLFKAHFGREVFNYEGWMRIATEFDGKLPIAFSAAPEGTVVPTKNVLAVVENTHDDFPWLPGHLETFILRSVWYPTTVATKSFNIKKVIKKYFDRTSCLEGEELDVVINTRLHDFGARGATSEESAAIGGLAHLYSFIGTDTVEAMILAQDLFDVACAGFSIPAREHSTTISYENEDDAYRNSIELYGEGFYSCVMDSTDYEAAVERVCVNMKDDIVAKGGTFVIRPDSGDMIRNIMFALETAGKHFGYEYNEKGFKVLSKHVRIIQGDDINSAADVERVLSWMEGRRWSAENIAFGMGGGLLQKVNRDTHKFAMKLSAIRVNGEWREVFKCPKGAEWKKSKAGILRLVKDDEGNFKTINLLEGADVAHNVVMEPYFISGVVTYKDTLQEIRDRIDSQI